MSSLQLILSLLVYIFVCSGLHIGWYLVSDRLKQTCYLDLVAFDGISISPNMWQINNWFDLNFLLKFRIHNTPSNTTKHITIIRCFVFIATFISWYIFELLVILHCWVEGSVWHYFEIWWQFVITCHRTIVILKNKSSRE